MELSSIVDWWDLSGESDESLQTTFEISFAFLFDLFHQVVLGKFWPALLEEVPQMLVASFSEDFKEGGVGWVPVLDLNGEKSLCIIFSLVSNNGTAVDWSFCFQDSLQEGLELSLCFTSDILVQISFEQFGVIFLDINDFTAGLCAKNLNQ